MPSFPSLTGARRILVAIWIGFFLVNLGIVFALYWNGQIYQETFDRATTILSSAYAPYVGIVTLFYWGKSKVSRGGLQRDRQTAFVLAVTGTLVWNALIFLLLLRLVLQIAITDDALAQIERLTSLFSWLVAGAVGAYFGTEP